MIPYIDAWLQNFIFGGQPGSESAMAVDALFLLIFWFSAFFFVLLMGLMVYWTIKYRRRPGTPAPVSPHHNTPLEILWTVVPSSALLVIFLLGFWGYVSKMVPASGALELKVDGFKWGWNITYPSGVTSTEVMAIAIEDKTYPVFYVPENTPVSLRMSSSDVIHAFWIPAFRTKMDVYPNRYSGFTFHTPTLGVSETVTDISSGSPVEIPGRDLIVYCAEYCGDDHSRMAATLRVVPQDLYEAKLRSFESTGDPIKDGERIYAVRCASCHTVNGSPSIGPTWKDMFGYEVIFNDGASLVRDENYIRESIYVPGAHIVAGYAANMPSFQGQISEPQLEALIAYMKSLSDRGGTPASTGDPAADDAAGQPTGSDTSTAPESSQNHDGGES